MSTKPKETGRGKPMTHNELTVCIRKALPILFDGFDGVQYRGRIDGVANEIAKIEYRKPGKPGQSFTAYLERRSWDRLRRDPETAFVAPLEAWEAVECGGMLTIEVKGVKPVAVVMGLYERPEEAKANAALICAALAMRQALERIAANAAESPEWIRRTASEGLAKLKGRAE